MRKLLYVVALFAMLAFAASACAAQPTPLPDYKPPTVELERVEVSSYFPWPAPPPTVGAGTPAPAPTPAVRIPLILDFVFKATNPNPYNVSIEGMKYTVEFEAAPNVYFPVNTPILRDRVVIPGNSTQYVRSTMVLDSTIVPSNLAVTSGAKLAANNLKGPDLVAKWWQEIGDFKFKIKASQGTAEVKSEKGGSVVTFESVFPK